MYINWTNYLPPGRKFGIYDFYDKNIFYELF